MVTTHQKKAPATRRLGGGKKEEAQNSAFRDIMTATIQNFYYHSLRKYKIALNRSDRNLLLGIILSFPLLAILI
jgi:hypothetical protein